MDKYHKSQIIKYWSTGHAAEVGGIEQRKEKCMFKRSIYIVLLQDSFPFILITQQTVKQTQMLKQSIFAILYRLFFSPLPYIIKGRTGSD